MPMQANGYGLEGNPANSALLPLDAAIYSTVAYRDRFDYAPSLGEIHRYLHGYQCEAAEVKDRLSSSQWLRAHIVTDGTNYCISGRDKILAETEQRSTRANSIWPTARKLGSLLAHLPHVKMVAVTGSLSVHNPEGEADIDFMMVTAGGMMWRVRALSKLLQVLDRRIFGNGLCANYHISTKSLALSDRRLYVAQELTQMVPLFGHEVYNRLRAANPWTDSLLPNATGAPPQTPSGELKVSAWFKTPMEWIASSPVGQLVEKFESRRKLHKYNETDYLKGRWSRFTQEACGHRLHIASAIEASWQNRLAEAGVSWEPQL